MSTRQIAIAKLMSAVSIAQAGTAYSNPLPFRTWTGFSLTGVVKYISTDGTITITQQCSLDYDAANPTAANWYVPSDSSGSAIAAATIITAVATTTGSYTTYTPIATPWIRFRVVETNTAPTIVTLTFAFQEEV